MLFLTSVRNMVDIWRIFIWLDWALSAVLRLGFLKIWHSGCIKEKSLFNSVNNTCIFYKCLLWVFLGFDVTICKITGCFGIKTLLHVTCQCKLRFLEINMHIIGKKNIHVLCNIVLCHMSVIWWKCYLYYCFLSLLSLAGKMAVFFWLGSDLTLSYVVFSL